jgi:solute carrier family 8 (sodium/calcium exchanger)
MNLISLADGEESEKVKKPGFFNYFLHILNFPWRLTAALVPPESKLLPLILTNWINNGLWLGLMNGYPCFVGSVAVLGLLSSLLGDFATLFGCTVQLDDAVTAVALVAFGTTVPGNNGSRNEIK